MAETAAGTAKAVEIAEAAQEFLATLSPEQRTKATFEIESDDRQNWHYVPMPKPARTGLPRGDMSTASLKAADELIASSLPEESHKRAVGIMELELILREIEDGQGSNVFYRSPDHYCFSVYGTPGGEGAWGWQVDGHHLSLNVTVVNGEVVSGTPCFFGANPAEVKHGQQKGLRLLRQEEDLARELLLSLNPDQRERAIIYPVAPADLITRASKRVEMGSPVGLAAELLSGDQRDRLMSLVRVYTDRMADHAGRDTLRKIEAAGVKSLFFGWAGGEHRGEPHYYRVHGASFLVEYDNTQNMANHIHSVWRDAENDFGVDVLKDHYRRDHGG